MTRPWSLRTRLVRRVMLWACLGWLAGVGLAALVIAHEMRELLDEGLETAAELALALYQEGSPVELPARDDSRVRIVDGGVVVSDAPWPVLTDEGGRNLPGWRVFRLNDPTGRVAVEVGQTDERRRDELRESLGWLVTLLLPVLLAAPLAIRGTIGAALRPATQLAEQLRARSARELSPVAAPDLPTELAPIPQAVNGYLAIIRARIEAERQFAANAAHELRTPIAAASGQAQLIAAGLADRDAAARLAEALNRMGTLIERLLHLSRTEGGGAGGGPCDLVRVTRMVIADLGMAVPFDDGDQPAVTVDVGPDALAVILGNLLRNAADHGTGDVRIVLRPGAVLALSNAVATGARFRFGIFDKAAGSKGAGLGLAIVARLAEAQGIAIRFAMTRDRAVVFLRFPVGPDAAAVVGRARA